MIKLELGEFIIVSNIYRQVSALSYLNIKTCIFSASCLLHAFFGKNGDFFIEVQHSYISSKDGPQIFLVHS